jgi:hypothetical protein
MIRTTPKTSMFPEIDVASKVASKDPISPAGSRGRRSFQNLLSRLSNSNSHEIRKGLATSSFFVRVADAEVEGTRPVTMMSEENGCPILTRLI